MDAFLPAVRHAVTRLRRDVLLTLTAVVSLAIGLGANTAVFTIAYALLFQPQPGLARPDELVDIGRTQDGYGFNPVSYPDFIEVQARATTLQGVYAYNLFPQAMRMTTGAERDAEQVYGTFVSASYFPLLGTAPAAGRLLQPSDGEGLSAAPVAVIGDGLWKRLFGSAPDTVGRVVRINGQAFAIVGVAPAGFHGTGLRRPEVWMLIGAFRNEQTATMLSTAETSWLMLGGRRKPASSIADANAELAVIGRTLTSHVNAPSRGLRAATLSPIAGGASSVAAFLVLIEAIVGGILVVACTNVAGMLLSRVPARRREMAIRAAVGATRRHLVRQLLVEAAVLFSISGVVALLVGLGTTRAIVALLPALPFPIVLSLPIDARAMAFTTLLAFGAAFLAGLVPAVHGANLDLSFALNVDRQGPSRMRLRRAFVVAQVAVSLVLVIVGGLFMRAMQHAGAANAGFDPRGVDLVSFTSGGGVPTLASVVPAIVERVRAIPGVEAATAAATFPGGFESMRLGSLTLPGHAGDPLDGDWNSVQPGYFATIRTPLLAGRDFTSADRAGSPPVAIVGEGVVRRLWPGRRPAAAVGEVVEQHEYVPSRRRVESTLLTVVGVAGDPSYGTLIDGATGIYVYVPFAQQPVPRMMVVARTTDAHSVATEIRTAIAAADRRLDVVSAQPAVEYASLGLMPQRIGAAVGAALGLIGVLLAGVGVYGVTAYTVTSRTREIGIRLALGAPLRAVGRMVLREGMSLVVVGSLIGLLAGAGAANVIAGYLAGLPPLDVVTFGGTVALFATIGFAACAMPLRRALGVEPLDALRDE